MAVTKQSLIEIPVMNIHVAVAGFHKVFVLFCFLWSSCWRISWHLWCCVVGQVSCLNGGHLFTRLGALLAGVPLLCKSNAASQQRRHRRAAEMCFSTGMGCCVMSCSQGEFFPITGSWGCVCLWMVWWQYVTFSACLSSTSSSYTEKWTKKEKLSCLKEA